MKNKADFAYIPGKPLKYRNEEEFKRKAASIAEYHGRQSVSPSSGINSADSAINKAVKHTGLLIKTKELSDNPSVYNNQVFSRQAASKVSNDLIRDAGKVPVSVSSKPVTPKLNYSDYVSNPGLPPKASRAKGLLLAATPLVIAGASVAYVQNKYSRKKKDERTKK